MTKYISEILKELSEISGRKAKAQYLRENDTQALRMLLAYGLHPNVEFYTNKIPEYQPDDAPIGRNPNNLFRAWRQLYVFVKDHPCSEERKTKVLTQLLEGLHKDEAEIIEQIIRQKGFEAKGLTANLVHMAFPGLLGEVQDEEQKSENNEVSGSDGGAGV